MSNDGLECNINTLAILIRLRYEDLRIQSIWLFVAILGCWGINQKETQLLALFIVFFLFYSKLTKNKGGNLSFAKQIKNINSEIDNSSFDKDIKKARRYDLGKIESELLSKYSVFKTMPEFIVVYLFWGWSLCVFLWRFDIAYPGL